MELFSVQQRNVTAIPPKLTLCYHAVIKLLLYRNIVLAEYCGFRSKLDDNYHAKNNLIPHFTKRGIIIMYR